MEPPLELLVHINKCIMEERARYEDKIRRLRAYARDESLIAAADEAYDKFIRRVEPLQRQRQWIVEEMARHQMPEPPLLVLPKPDKSTKVPASKGKHQCHG